MGVVKNANLMLEGHKLKIGEIAIFILKLSSKAQIRP
jgi:hypothetical protein